MIIQGSFLSSFIEYGQLVSEEEFVKATVDGQDLLT